MSLPDDDRVFNWDEPETHPTPSKEDPRESKRVACNQPLACQSSRCPSCDGDAPFQSMETLMGFIGGPEDDPNVETRFYKCCGLEWSVKKRKGEWYRASQIFPGPEPSGGSK